VGGLGSCVNTQTLFSPCASPAAPNNLSVFPPAGWCRCGPAPSAGYSPCRVLDPRIPTRSRGRECCRRADLASRRCPPLPSAPAHPRLVGTLAAGCSRQAGAAHISLPLFITLFSFCSSIIQAGTLPVRALSFNRFRQRGLEMKGFPQLRAEYLEMGV